MVGFIEKSIADEFGELSISKQKYFKTFKKLGKNYIDKMCNRKGYDEKIKLIQKNTDSYVPLNIFKYEVLGNKNTFKFKDFIINFLEL